MQELRDIVRKDTGARGRGDAPVIEDAQSALLIAFNEGVATTMPGLWKRASAADGYWVERVRSSLPESLHFVDFRRLYYDDYDHFAAADHPTTTGLQVFTHFGDDPRNVTVDCEPERDLEGDLRPYWIATLAFGVALLGCLAAGGISEVAELALMT